MKKKRKVYSIDSLSLAIKVHNELEKIKEAALYALKSSENPETFKVTVKRVDKSFPTGSQEMNQIIGGHLLKYTDGIKVNIHEQDVEVRVEFRNKATYIKAGSFIRLRVFHIGIGVS